MKKSFCLAFVLTSLVVLCLTGGCKVDVETPDYNLHTVTFECNGGSSISPQILVHGTTAAEPRRDPTKDGVQFLGWYADPQFNKPFDFGTPITQDMTIYAKWVYKVYFYDYYGNIWKTVDVVHGYKVERPNNNPVLKESYRDFDDWYVDSEKSAVFDFEIPITDSIIIYAGYRPNTWYTITFETNGGNEIPPQQVGHADKVIKPENPTKDGYTFNGWYSDAEFNSEYDFTNEVVGSKTLYAKWFEFAATKYRELPAGTDGTAGPSWTYVEFGDWPQTIKAENVTVDENDSIKVGMFTYYKGSDGAWYVKKMECAGGVGFKYSDGTEVAQKAAKSYKYFKVEPIKWRVLTTDYDGKKLLCAEDALLCSQWFDAELDNHYIYYFRSSLHSFLNSDFLITAFSYTGASVCGLRLDNSPRSMNPDGNPNFWTERGYQYYNYDANSPFDLIFVLSVQEWTKYRFNGKISDYTKASGSDSSCWFRSCLTDSSWCSYPCFIGKDGLLTVLPVKNGGAATRDVIPALCVEN